MRLRTVALATAALVSGLVTGPPADAAPAPAPHPTCSTARAGSFHCLSVWRHGSSVVRTGAAAVAPPTAGLRPADIRSAYRIDTARGAGQTIAIVDAFDNPNAEADLAVYRSTFGLPPCTTANGCFRKVNQRGGTVPPAGDPGWGVEIALDVQAVSAACPQCHILLVEADDPSFESIGAAVNTAVRLGADVVSNSYGADEFNGVLGLSRQFYTHPGVAQVVSSGDFGFGPASFPASARQVIAVGGTKLIRRANGTWGERAWDSAGSGCSAWFAKPAWQKDPNCLMRTVSDVSALGDPDPGFAVYDTFGLGPDNGWIVVGGTSLAAPLIAGMIGLAGNAPLLGNARYLYNHRAGLKDVVGGSNGFCGGDYLCTGLPGYDAPTGLGAPRGLAAL